MRSDEIVPGGGRAEPVERGPIAEVRHYDRVLDGRQSSDSINRFWQRLESFSPIDIAVARDQQPGFDLTEAIEDALHAEVRRTRGPHRTGRRAAENGDNRLRQVWQVRGYAIAGTDAGRTQR